MPVATSFIRRSDCMRSTASNGRVIDGSGQLEPAGDRGGDTVGRTRIEGEEQRRLDQLHLDDRRPSRRGQQIDSGVEEFPAEPAAQYGEHLLANRQFVVRGHSGGDPLAAEQRARQVQVQVVDRATGQHGRLADRMTERSVQVDQRGLTPLVDVGQVGLDEDDPTGIMQGLGVLPSGLGDSRPPGVEPPRTHRSSTDRRLDHDVAGR